MCTLKRPMNTKTRKIPIVVHIETLNEHENEENSTKLCTLKRSMNTRERNIHKVVHIEVFNEHQRKGDCQRSAH